MWPISEALKTGNSVNEVNSIHIASKLKYKNCFVSHAAAIIPGTLSLLIVTTME